jgi:hypothetical protein
LSPPKHLPQPSRLACHSSREILFCRTLSLRGQLVITLNSIFDGRAFGESAFETFECNAAVPHGKAQIALWTPSEIKRPSVWPSTTFHCIMNRRTVDAIGGIDVSTQLTDLPVVPICRGPRLLISTPNQWLHSDRPTPQRGIKLKLLC